MAPRQQRPTSSDEPSPSLLGHQVIIEQKSGGQTPCPAHGIVCGVTGQGAELEQFESVRILHSDDLVRLWMRSELASLRTLGDASPLGEPQINFRLGLRSCLGGDPAGQEVSASGSLVEKRIAVWYEEMQAWNTAVVMGADGPLTKLRLLEAGTEETCDLASVVWKLDGDQEPLQRGARSADTLSLDHKAVAARRSSAGPAAVRWHVRLALDEQQSTIQTHVFPKALVISEKVDDHLLRRVRWTTIELDPACDIEQPTHAEVVAPGVLQVTYSALAAAE
jgi:hypothetical protein